MAQIEPVDASLGPARTGAAIGATLYQLDGSTVHAAFSTSGWYEAPAGSGAWHHPGLSLPDAGGVVAVGISGTEYMRQAVGAAKPTAAEIWAYGQRTLTGMTNNVTVVSAVSGGVVTVFARDTWRFTLVSSALDLAPYEKVAFVVKRPGQTDDEALLYVRSDSGLVRIGGADATPGDGSLTIDSATQISVRIAIGVTGVEASDYCTWWIKGFDSTPVVDEGYTLATGAFRVLLPGLQATA